MIKDLEEERIPKAESEAEERNGIKEQIKALEKIQPPEPDTPKELDFLQRQLRVLSAVPTVEVLRTRLTEAKKLLTEKKDLAGLVQEKISSFLSPEQEFKRTMSITFAALIACVILGFFIVALRDDKIRQAIFAGESGMQFLTLFSLVIAIILFGITKILEGKELSALLGGLSGYILGRVAPRA